MDWPALIDFIRQRDPTFVSGLQGVPDLEIAALAADHGVTLPTGYAEFLRRMGLGSNGYTPFGATQDPGFAAISERLDEGDEPTFTRFFPIAIETDDSLEALYDHHLDLHRSDGDDATLVLLEQGVPLEWQTPVETSETFGEHITASVFSQFALLHHAHQDTLAVGGKMQAGEGRTALQQTLTLLQRAGFNPVLLLTERVACLQSGPLSVLAQVNDVHESLTLRLGSDTSLAVKELADQLLAGLPGARRPAGPRNLD